MMSQQASVEMMSFHVAEKPRTSSSSQEIRGSQCLSLHALHIDRRPVGYNEFAVDTGSFCNMKGWGSTYDKAVDHGVVGCGDS